MSTIYPHLALQQKTTLSKINTHLEVKNTHICSPNTGRKSSSKNKQHISPLKIKIKKLNTHQLFKDAHKINGETFLKDVPQSALLPTKVSSIMNSDSPKASKISKLLTVSINPKDQEKMKIKKVMEVNIVNEGGELTKIINQGICFNKNIEEFSFGNISNLQDHSNKLNMLKKCSSIKDDTLEQLLDILEPTEQ